MLGRMRSRVSMMMTDKMIKVHEDVVISITDDPPTRST